jgi:hypothetical protein
MEKLDLKAYQKVNESFGPRMVYRVGVDCGFFVEMNYMVNAMIYCLAHHIRFQLYSADANFGTGVGWTEYFRPFCEEVHESFHQKYNFHRLPSWRRVLELCRSQRSLGPAAWKIKKTVNTFIGRVVSYRAYGEKVLFAQDVPNEPVEWCVVPELGIDGDYMSTFALLARMVWRLHPDIQRQEDSYKTMLTLPPIYSGVQIRGGDKVTETRLIDGKTLIEKLNLHDGDSLFILTDDYRQFLQAREDFPKLKLSTLCQEDETGYHHKRFCQEDSQSKKKAITRLIISADLLLSSRSFVGSITTGPSVFILKLRHGDSQVQAIDCPKDKLPSILRLPLYARAKISTKNLKKVALTS